jgi:hypothetical protein
MKPARYMVNWRIEEKGRFRYLITPGIGFGPKPLKITYQAGNFVVVYQPGHLGWAGVGMGQKYVESYHGLFEVKPDVMWKLEGDYGYHQQHGSWQKARKHLNHLADQLNAGRLLNCRRCGAYFNPGGAGCPCVYAP